MSTIVILAVFGSALLHAAWNTMIKGGSDKFFETTLNTAGGALVSFILMLFLPSPLAAAWPYLAATALINIFYYVFMARSYRDGDFSYAYPLMRGTAPLLTALVTVFFLGDTLPGSGWLGVILLTSGILLLAFDALRRGRFSWAATLPALGNSLAIMAYTVVDGRGVRLSGHPLSYVCWIFLLNPLALFFLLSMTPRRSLYPCYLKSRWIYGLSGGACSLAAYALSLWGMTRAPIAQVAALRESSVLFGVILAVIFLKEKMTPARVAASLLVFAAAAVMRL